MPAERAVLSLESLAQGEESVVGDAEGTAGVLLGFIVAKPVKCVHGPAAEIGCCCAVSTATPTLPVGHMPRAMSAACTWRMERERYQQSGAACFRYGNWSGCNGFRVTTHVSA